VGLAALIAAHPRRSTRLDPLSDLEERKTLILMGLVGAVVAELVSVDSTMALVIFGIGGLIRFRTVLRNPKITGKAIMVVLIGLACGLGQFATAIFVTAFAWALIMWLESHLSARIKVRVHERVSLQALPREEQHDDRGQASCRGDGPLSDRHGPEGARGRPEERLAARWRGL
jgi:hypothetical protein